MEKLFQATAFPTYCGQEMFVNVLEGTPKTIDGQEYVEIEPGNLRLRDETWRTSRREALLDAAPKVAEAAMVLTAQHARLLRGEK